MYDVVRGVGRILLPSNTNAESTDTANVSSFDSDGFSFGGNVGVNKIMENLLLPGVGKQVVPQQQTQTVQ